MQTIVVFGAGGHAKAVIDTIEKEGRYQIAGLLDSHLLAGSFVYGYPILGDETWLRSAPPTIIGGIVAIGDNWIRAKVVDKLKEQYPAFTFITAIHPAASIAKGARIGEGTVVMAGAVINSDALLGEHCILYPHASIDHDSEIEKFVAFAPKAVTGGQVRIGAYSAVSIGACIIHGRTIGTHTVIGAGATVVGDIPDFQVAYGTPARIIRERKPGERYL